MRLLMNRARREILTGVTLGLIFILLFIIIITWVSSSDKEVIQTNELVWKPYVYWQREEGVRKTIQMKGKKVWVFGGSAVWGTGVEWNETIPSYLANYGYNVTNYGETGYVSTQELILLIQELKSGFPPDIVIFYDGFNDVFSAYQQGVAGLPMNEFNRVKEFNLSKKWVGEYLQAKLHKQKHNLNMECTNGVLYNYYQNIEMVLALSICFKFKFYSFWQDYNYKNNKFFDKSYELAKHFKQVLEVPEEYFIDQCHLTKEGNKIIAERIYNNIK